MKKVRFLFGLSVGFSLLLTTACGDSTPTTALTVAVQVTTAASTPTSGSVVATPSPSAVNTSAGNSTTASTTTTAAPTLTTPPVTTALDTPSLSAGQLVDVGGNKLYIKCTGQGNPTVILEARGGGTSIDWNLVQPVVEKTTRVCSYDRLGFGRSDRATNLARRSGLEMVEQLRTLLTNAKIEGPYVLVGHYLGGSNMRLYASKYPNEVAGVVLVDANHEDDIFTSVASIEDGTFREPPNGFSLKKTGEELKAAGPFKNIPLIVLTQGITLSPQWQEMQKKFVQLSPQGKLIIAEKSGRDITSEQPELIVAAIQEVVLKVRGS